MDLWFAVANDAEKTDRCSCRSKYFNCNGRARSIPLVALRLAFFLPAAVVPSLCRMINHASLFTSHNHLILFIYMDALDPCRKTERARSLLKNDLPRGRSSFHGPEPLTKEPQSVDKISNPLNRRLDYRAGNITKT